MLVAVCMALAAHAINLIRVEAGNSESLLAAIEEANKLNADSTAEATFILIPNGTYDLGDRVLTKISGHNIALVGQSTMNTVIHNAPDVANEGIRTTAILLNTGTNNYLQDLTLHNGLKYYEAGNAGRAVCLQDKGTRTICNRVLMLSYQDTYYSDNELCEHYMLDSEIHGTVDFICGAGDVWFEHCTIVTEPRTVEGKGRCVVAAPRTSKTQWGYVFNRCTVQSISQSFEYARGWHTTPRCVWLHTRLLNPNRLSQTRFDHHGMRTVQSFFKEYATTDAAGKDITPESNIVTLDYKEERNQIETIFTEKEASLYTVRRIFPKWRPDRVLQKREQQAAQAWKKYPTSASLH